MRGKLLLFGLVFVFFASLISAYSDYERYNFEHDYWYEDLPHHARFDSRKVPEDLRDEGIIWGRYGYYDKHERKDRHGNFVEDFYFHPYDEEQHNRYRKWDGYRMYYDGYNYYWDEDDRTLRLKHYPEYSRDRSKRIKKVYEQNYYDSQRSIQNTKWYDPVEVRYISLVDNSSVYVMQSLGEFKTYVIYG